MTQTQQPIDDRELTRLYADFDTEHLTPLWTQLDELMPMTPAPRAVPFVWKWSTLYPLAQRAGDLVPVGRGGERRAIALANPGLGGAPYVTPTLWAAIQYLGPRETAPEHRHSQNAFRFVVEGEGVWTVVNGDPVAMRRGDFLLTPGWHFHGHHNETDQPMAWIDGLDIPFVHYTDTGFFEFGGDGVTDESTPHVSRSERLWAILASVRWSAWTPGAVRPSRPTAGNTPTPRCANNSRSKTRGTRRQPNPATRRFATPTRPPAVTSCRPSAPSSTGCGRAPHQGPPRRRVPRLPGLRRCRPHPARRANHASAAATSSSSRPGCRGRCKPRPSSTSSCSPMPRSSRACISIAPSHLRSLITMKLATIRIDGSTAAVRVDDTRRHRRRRLP